MGQGSRRALPPLVQGEAGTLVPAGVAGLAPLRLPRRRQLQQTAEVSPGPPAVGRGMPQGHARENGRTCRESGYPHGWEKGKEYGGAGGGTPPEEGTLGGGGGDTHTPHRRRRRSGRRDGATGWSGAGVRTGPGVKGTTPQHSPTGRRAACGSHGRTWQRHAPRSRAEPSPNARQRSPPLGGRPSTALPPLHPAPRPGRHRPGRARPPPRSGSSRAGGSLCSIAPQRLLSSLRFRVNDPPRDLACAGCCPTALGNAALGRLCPAVQCTRRLDLPL